MGIQGYFFDKKIKQAKEKANELKKITSLSKVKKVLVFVDETSLFDQSKLKELETLMSLNSSDFDFLTFKGKKSSYNEFRGVVITPDSFNWQGNVSSNELKELLEKTFDLLVDYSSSDVIIKPLIVSSIKASFKIGFSVVNNELYDFVIAVEPNEISTFNKEVVRYLKILKIL
jgi:hypothetical protein